MVNEHCRRGAALTLATHTHDFGIPFGELRLAKDRVIQYLEKPVYRVQVCSGLAVLDSRAMAEIPAGCPTGLSTLTQRLIQTGLDVFAFTHAAPWIDVNDADAVARAEAMVAAEEKFECWARQPHHHVIQVLLRTPDGILLREEEDSGGRKIWTLPACPLEAESSAKSACDLVARLGFVDSVPDLLSSFDEVDVVTGHIVRQHLYLAEALGSATSVTRHDDKLIFVSQGDIDLIQASRTLTRSLAVVRAHRGI
jgi:hypothetical protein